MNGKSKCKILKDIRRQIAQDNDIEFVTAECKYQGDCSGTCPKCEAEVRYLEQELAKRQAAGKAIAVAGIAAALMVGSVGCGMDTPSTNGDIEPPASTSQTDPTQTDPTHTPPGGNELAGEPAVYPDSTEPTYEITAGVLTPPTDDIDPEEDDPYDHWYIVSGAVLAP